MYFWWKFLHIAAMATWFTGLFLLPRLFIAGVQDEDGAGSARLNAIGKTLYFGVMTPGAIFTVVLGIVLLGYGFDGAWLPAKLALVTLAVLLHVYFGQLLLDLSAGRARHSPFFYGVLNWIPLFLLLGISALVAAKPRELPPLGGI